MSDSFELPPLTLVIGGARSGKSAFAEGLIPLPATYIATAEARDVEMQIRVAEHQKRRQKGWTTIEAPYDVVSALKGLAPPSKAALVDCATLWLSNHLLADADLQQECAALLEALTKASIPVVIVSNEVGWSIVPENALARKFQDAHGKLNQMIASHADLVVAVMAGLPLVLKGALPITNADHI